MSDSTSQPTPPASPTVTRVPAKAGDDNGMALASLVLGIISVCLFLFSGGLMGFFFAIPGVICGHIALGRERVSPTENGQMMATIGLIMSWIVLILTILIVIVSIVLILLIFVFGLAILGIAAANS